MPKISIIVPCYGVEKYLYRCVDSLISQTLKDIEIILVDDESPDKVPYMCDEWASKDSRIKVIHKKNGGLGMACNSGIEAATGEYIAFCDSDDYVDAACYETMYKYIKLTKSDAVYAGIKRIDEFGCVTPLSQPEKEAIYDNDSIINFMFDMVASVPSAPTERIRQMSAKIVLYSGDIIRKQRLKFHSERQFLSEDLLFNLDFLSHCNRVAELAQSFYYYYVNTASLSQTLRRDRFERYKVLREYMLTRYNFDCKQKEFNQRVDKMFIGYVRSAMIQIITSTLSTEEKLQLLSQICRDNIWQSISKEFPVNKLPLPKRGIYWLTKHKCTKMLYIFLNLINNVKK